MIINAKGPANFAEKYIIHSIWDGHYPPGSLLPAERELSEHIGITRTTLREVLQRLARDGWLTIQHGKPTRVNNFWETSGLNILETLAELDQNGASKLMENLLAARKNISMIYIKLAVSNNRAALLQFFEDNPLENNAEAFAHFDYLFHHTFALLSNNPIYVLILNGFKKLHIRGGLYFFKNREARMLTEQYYNDILSIIKKENESDIDNIVKNYNVKSQPIWQSMRASIAEKYQS
jgi:GntR family transcriptional regulator, negative regulator for fad regulon and positive regulator of fabA